MNFGIRLFHLLNEVNEGDQVGPRDSAFKLLKQNKIHGYYPFSFLVEEKKTSNWENVLQEIINKIIEFKPNIILASHIGNHFFPEWFFSHLESGLGYKPLYAYDERDVFGIIRKPVPKAVIQYLRKCDAIFLVATGDYAKRLKKYTKGVVYYLPNVVSLKTFDKSWKPTYDRLFDVVMIANNYSSKLPLLSMPGVNDRKILANKLHSKFGDKFGLFGSGWEGKAKNLGPIKFNDQVEIIRHSWLSIGYDHFPDYDLYFSNRLPIAMISGVLHVTKKKPGLENLFTDFKHCVFFDTVEEAIDLCATLIKLPKTDLIKMGEFGSDLIRNKFTEDIRFEKMINKLENIGLMKKIKEQYH